MSFEVPEYLQIPEALKSHPELIKRGLILDHPLNAGSVYATDPFKPPQFVVKVLNSDNEEEAIVHRLQHDTSARNHLIPCEIVPSDPALLVMPSVYDLARPMLQQTSKLVMLRICLGLCHQIAEGVNHLHSLRIAHLDLCFGNVLVALDDSEEEHPQTKGGRVYIIDFDRSRQLDLDPGRQPAIELPSTQYKPPLQMKVFDPYSWDVYCMGKLFERLTKTIFFQSPPPWFVAKLCQWVIGSERGCLSICHCRPSARRVLLVLTILERTVSFLEVLGKPIYIIHAFLVSLRSRARMRDYSNKVSP